MSSRPPRTTFLIISLVVATVLAIHYGVNTPFLAELLLPPSAPDQQQVPQEPVPLGDEANLFRQLVQDAGWGNKGPAAMITEPPGTPPGPKVDFRRFVLSGDAATVRQSLIKACEGQGLTAPDAALLADKPKTVCVGTWRQWRVSVQLGLSCTTVCEANLSVETRPL